MPQAHARSSGKDDKHSGALFTTEMEKGASDEKAYPPDVEVGCAVCSVLKRFEGAVYTRWGHNVCSNGARKLYSGFMAGAKYNHKGGAVNYVCMHPHAQRPRNAHKGNQNGNRLCAPRAPPSPQPRR